MEVIEKHTELKEVDIVDKRYKKCDKCGCVIKKTSSFEVFESTFKVESGVSYPEGGHGTDQSIDLCQDCSNDFIFLLKKNKYNINTKEWEI